LLTFGKLEPLVCLMQETPIDRLLPTLFEQLKAGTELVISRQRPQQLEPLEARTTSGSTR
jgi:hypothetical protein